MAQFNNGHATGCGAETRDDLLQAANLWEYFCQRTSADVVNKYKSRENPMPFSFVIITVIVTVFMTALKKELIFIGIAALLAEIVWMAFSRSGSGVDSILRGIESGTFPREIRESVVGRLRWWSMLIVPQDWTTNSRLYEMRDHMKQRLKELDKDIEYWQSAEGMAAREEGRKQAAQADVRKREQQQKLKLLQSRGVNVTGLDDEEKPVEEKRESYADPEALAFAIRNAEQRDYHLMRIRKIREPLERCLEDRVFLTAMLIKSEKIITLLDQLKALEPSLEAVTAENLDGVVREVIHLLEQRRALVIELNRIPPKKVLPLFMFDYGVSSRLSGEEG